jgi:hypothetical protein
MYVTIVAYKRRIVPVHNQQRHDPKHHGALENVVVVRIVEQFSHVDPNHPGGEIRYQIPDQVSAVRVGHGFFGEHRDEPDIDEVEKQLQAARRPIFPASEQFAFVEVLERSRSSDQIAVLSLRCVVC